MNLSQIPKVGYKRSLNDARTVVLRRWEYDLRQYNRKHGGNISLNCFLCLNGKFNGVADLIKEVEQFDRFDYYKSVARYNNNYKVKMNPKIKTDLNSREKELVEHYEKQLNHKQALLESARQITEATNEELKKERTKRMIKEDKIRKLEKELRNFSIRHVSVSLFNEALRIMSDLAEHQNGAPLIRHEDEYNKTMTEVWDFLAANEI
jgi:hypothetical protein